MPHAGQRRPQLGQHAQAVVVAPAVPPDCVLLHVDDPRIRSDNLFDYLGVLHAAHHFHTIDSCLAWLAALCGFDVPMTVHAYAKDAGMEPAYERSGRVRVVRSV